MQKEIAVPALESRYNQPRRHGWPSNVLTVVHTPYKSVAVMPSLQALNPKKCVVRLTCVLMVVLMKTLKYTQKKGNYQSFKEQMMYFVYKTCGQLGLGLHPKATFKTCNLWKYIGSY